MPRLLSKQNVTTRSRADLAPRAADIKDSAALYAETAREAATQYAGAAKEWAAPRLETAVGATKTKVDDVAPKVAAAVAGALVAAEPVREEVKTRGSAAIAALKGDLAPPPSRKRRPKGKLLVLVAALAGAVAGWRMWSAKQSGEEWSNQWQSAPGAASSTSSSTGDTAGSAGTATLGGTAAAGAEGQTLDGAAASPDEALADTSLEAPEADRTPTTPDDPADITLLGTTSDRGQGTTDGGTSRPSTGI